MAATGEGVVRVERQGGKREASPPAIIKSTIQFQLKKNPGKLHTYRHIIRILPMKYIATALWTPKRLLLQLDPIPKPEKPSLSRSSALEIKSSLSAAELSQSTRV